MCRTLSLRLCWHVPKFGVNLGLNNKQPRLHSVKNVDLVVQPRSQGIFRGFRLGRRFRGVRWTRDQPTPGSFPDPPQSHGNGPGNEVEQQDQHSYQNVNAKSRLFGSSRYCFIAKYRIVILSKQENLT